MLVKEMRWLWLAFAVEVLLEMPGDAVFGEKVHTARAVVEEKVPRYFAVVVGDPEERIFGMWTHTEPSRCRRFCPDTGGNRRERAPECRRRDQHHVAHGVIAMKRNVHGAVGVERG